MPFNVMVHDQAPALTLAGSQRLGAGLARGIDQLGEGIAKAIEKRKQRGDLATALRKAASIAYPDRKDDFAAMGGPELQGFFEGEAMKSAMARQAREDRRAELSTRVDEARLARETALPGFTASLGRMLAGGPSNNQLTDFYENPENYPGGPPSGPGAQRALAQALQDSPGVDLSEAAQMARALDALGDSRARSLFTGPELGTLRPTKIPGTYFMPTSTGGGQVVTDPLQALQSQEITDAQGNKHTVLVSPRGTPQQLRDRKPFRLPKELFEQMANTVAGMKNPDPKKAALSRERLKNIIDAGFIGKQIDEDQRDAFYEMYEFDQAGGGGASAGPPAKKFKFVPGQGLVPVD